ncbi:MAG: Stf0 family sulfotransferase [Pseudomonadota bacterium]
MQISYDQVGLHEAELRRYFDTFALEQSAVPLGRPVCILLFTNRSGSSLVSEHLRATNCFTGLGEPLNYKLVRERCDEEGIRHFPDYIRWLVDRMGREGAMYGLKASFDQAMMLVRAGIVPGFFNDVRWVLIERSDILSQAVSFSIASQTKKWHSHRGEAQVEPQYDFAQIRKRVQTLSQAYAAMNSFCAVFDLNPYRINYEQFAAEPVGGAEALAAYLGYPEARVDESRLKMRKQRNEVNAQFRDRFVEEFRASMRD